MVEVKQNSTTIATYGYDPFDQRLWKEADNNRTYYYYSDEGLTAEATTTGTLTTVYGYWPDSVWSTDRVYLKQNGQYNYAQNDHLGTPLKYVSNTGAVTWSAYYKPFGEVILNPNNSITNNQRFAGQYYDAETNLHYNGRRYYDPQTDRYLSEDPMGLAGGLNRYAYVDHDPVNLMDPSGECGLVGAIVEGAIDVAQSAVIQHYTKGCVDWGEAFGEGAPGIVSGFFCGAGHACR